MDDFRELDNVGTRYATGINNFVVERGHVPNRRQIGVTVTVEDFQKVKDEALRQGTSMGAVLRQLIELL